ncbi:hypothetical protein BT96DRAFT_951359 [Gymnopus androsaceus JB14]|uniref:Uncharacterized protein n=1 Tax=Gymnopus androsaceus JB14 TaxID=1447944 RepID=A0A6A4GD10_9AGAR|nr:hypothetical protein BT96DRAFT_951359 [Gymnopus androsaceus JB14]
MLSNNTTIATHSGVPRSKRKVYSPSRSMRKALAGLGLGARLGFTRKSSVSSSPYTSHTVHSSTAIGEGLNAFQTTDSVPPLNIQPLWEPSTSVAAHLPIIHSKSEISIGQLEKYISKYSEKGLLGLLPIDEPSQLSLTQMCHYIPRRSDYTTIITIDNYDAPFLNAPPGRLTDVEDVIAELFYGNVLAVFGGYGVMRPKLIIMGSGMRDYPVPAKRIVEWLSLVDCTRNPCYAGMVGLTTSEIEAGVQALVEDEGIHLALFKEIENTCWRESFMEGSDAEATIFTRSGVVYDSSVVAAVVAAIGCAQIFTQSGEVQLLSKLRLVLKVLLSNASPRRRLGTNNYPGTTNRRAFLVLNHSEKAAKSSAGNKGVPTKDGSTELTVVWKLEVKMVHSHYFCHYVSQDHLGHGLDLVCTNSVPETSKEPVSYTVFAWGVNNPSDGIRCILVQIY